jgi:MoxR-like ATPase
VSELYGTGAAEATPSRTGWFAERYEELARNVELFIRGKASVVRMALTCMLAEGHLLLEDVPGTGKTSLARCISASIDGKLGRIQFTPDLLPSDVTGVQIYDSHKQEFVFHPGAVFANLVLADEINRASPKTQSALLEVMEERQVTVDGRPYILPRPFLVIATQNPIEHSGTYALPEAQIDRFMMRMSVGYPNHDAEVDIIAGRTKGQTPEQLKPVMTTSDLVQMIDIAREVYLAPAVVSYIITITGATRRLPELRLGVSPRGSSALAVASQARAAAEGRHFVTADDVKALAPYVLGHRMLLRPEAELQGASTDDLLQTILASVPVPQQRVSA